MKPVITKEEAQAWMRRWRIVNDAERRELQSMSSEAKLLQLERLMRTARLLNWKTSTEEEDEAVRQRWMRLKEHVSES